MTSTGYEVSDEKNRLCLSLFPNRYLIIRYIWNTRTEIWLSILFAKLEKSMVKNRQTQINPDIVMCNDMNFNTFFMTGQTVTNGCSDKTDGNTSKYKKVFRSHIVRYRTNVMNIFYQRNETRSNRNALICTDANLYLSKHTDISVLIFLTRNKISTSLHHVNGKLLMIKDWLKVTKEVFA